MQIKGILLLLLLAGVCMAADEVPLPRDEAGRVVYTEVVQADGLDQAALYGRALEWFAKTFNSAQAVLQLQDKDNGKLLGKALLEVTIKSLGKRPAGVVHYTFGVQVKDGRYRYELTGLHHERAGVEYQIGDGGDLGVDKPACIGKLINGMTKGQWRAIREQAHVFALSLVAGFKAFMAEQPAGGDW